tara:strand:+ start:106 stop:1305 length:1200 start_codon:yes stop_codon:yes gene_type:complete
MSVTKISNDNIENIEWSKLTGPLPAMDGSALTGIVGGTTVMKAASDPANNTNPADGVGTMYLNTTDGNMFICMDATTDQNEWNNVGPGTGGVAYVPPQYFGDRALWMGGSHASYGYNNVNNVSYQSIPTLGSTIIWGSLAVGHGDGPGTLSNGTRALCVGGYNGGNAVNPQIDYVTVATIGSAAVFGNVQAGTWRWMDGTSNGTRGIFTPPLYGNSSTQIQYVTVATTGNASNFGQMTYNGSYYGWGSVACNGSRAVHFGGYHTHKAMLYVDIATTGNSQLFGELTNGRFASSAFNDRTYGVCWGGWDGSTVPAANNEYITIATTGNALVFANSTTQRSNGGSCSNETRGFYKFGYLQGWGALSQNIEYVTINNPSQNAINFGNLTGGRTTVHGTSGNP